jgi:hypothetical protein
MIGPPMVRVVLMYCDNGVLRVLRSAGGALEFGPASAGGVDIPIRFTFRSALDAGFGPHTKIWPVFWRRYDDDRCFAQVALHPIAVHGAIHDGWDVRIRLSVTLDKRSWLVNA